MKPSPPYRALKFLRWFCREDFIEEVEGDLIEVFEYQYKQSPKKAKSKLIWTVIRYFRPEFIKAFNLSPNSTTMYQHNFKLAYRNFFKYKSTFFINLIGLSTGLACALLISLWIADEQNVDKFHEKDARLYQVMHNIDLGNEIRTLEWTPGPLIEALDQQMPEVENVAAVFPPSVHTFKGALAHDDIRMKASSKYVSSDYFSIFSHPILAGDKDQLLKEKYAVVISDQLALKLFGSTDNVVGKLLKWEVEGFSGDYFVSGIFESMPSNASIQFDLAFNYDLYASKNPELNRWSYNDPCTYLTLKEGSDVKAFENKIAGLIKKNDPESKGTLFLRKYSSQYLYGNFENGLEAGGRISYVILFSVIAIFLLLIACINFMNLSTARASRRIKEIGVKKSIGAKRSDLVIQHLMESVIMSFLALFLAMLMVTLILPEFNVLTGKQLLFVFSSEFIFTVLGITLITGLLAGSYPALYLSGITPISIFRGSSINSLSSLWIRKGLVIFQFAVSLVLIVMVFTVSKQMDYIQTKNLGYDKENVLIFNETINNDASYTSFKHQLKTVPGVLSISSISGDMTTGDRNNTTGIMWEGRSEDNLVDFSDLVVDFNFFETMNIELLEGRAFSEEFNSEKNKIIFNETAINQMGLVNPIGQTVRLWGKEKQIIGVVKDFHVESLYKTVKPSFFRLSERGMNTLVRIEQGKERETIEALQDIYKEKNQGLALDYQFIDDAYDKLYASESRVSILSGYFAGIAILISCLGLFGLAAFTAEIRLKEIGIRKVLGSGNTQIVLLLSNEYTKMVLIANLLALPIGYYLVNNWLGSFAFSIELKWWSFVGAGILSLMISWLTVGIQTVKAAMINPVDCLKDE